MPGDWLHGQALERTEILPVMSIDAEAGRLLADAAERARRYLAGLDRRPVAPDRAALSALASFDQPLPGEPADPAATLALLPDAASPAPSATPAPPPSRF